MRLSKIQISLFASLFLPGICIASPYDAPADSVKNIQIDEVVVTAKEHLAPRHQALSVSSFLQKDIQNQAVTSVKGLSAQVPNLFMPNYGSKYSTPIYIRGIGSRMNTPAIGMYVDNIPLIEKSSFDFNFSDIESIDVLRGPQNTLYGRNAMGGLIRIFSKNPFKYQGTDVRLTAATYNDYRVSATHYHRLSNQFAFSGSVFYDHKGGFFKNSLTGKRADRSDEFGARLRGILLTENNMKVDFHLSYEHLKMGAFPYTLTGLTDNNTDQSRYDKLSPYFGQVAFDSEGGYRRDLINFGVNLEKAARTFTFNSVTGGQLLDDRMDIDQDSSPLDEFHLTQKQFSQVITQEFIFKSLPGRNWLWTTGLSGFYQSLNTNTFMHMGDDFVKGTVEAPVNRIFQGMHGMNINIQSPMGIPSISETPILSASLYHQSTFNDLLTRGLSLTLGARVDYEKMWLGYDTRFGMSYTFNMAAMPPYVPELHLPFQPTWKTIGSTSNDYFQFLPKATLKYEWGNSHNIYATFSKGYRSGGFNIQNFGDFASRVMPNVMMRAMQDDPKYGQMFVQRMGTPTDPSNPRSPRVKTEIPEIDVKAETYFKPEYAYNYEVGTHLNLFANRLALDAAAFYMDTYNQQVTRFAAQSLGRVTENVGRSRSWGAEMALKARITDLFSLFGNMGFTKATFTKYETVPARSTTMVDYSGNYVPFIPRYTANVGGEYVFRVKADWLDNITLNANYVMLGKTYWDDANTLSEDAYGLLNGRLNFNKGNGQLAFWINNALNKEYNAFAFLFMNSKIAQKGIPMQMGVDLRCTF